MPQLLSGEGPWYVKRGIAKTPGQIFTDGRALPVDPNPTWFGYSIGKWEGDTFVVDTAGFKEGTWLDNGGHPHTDALHLIEHLCENEKDLVHMVGK